MEYKLVWEDDFNVDGPVNPKIWNVEHAGTGFGNNEDQYYTQEKRIFIVKIQFYISLPIKKIISIVNIPALRLPHMVKISWIRYG